jgi:N utilization substance protein B
VVELGPEEIRRRIDRHRARGWGVQVLYRWESEGGGGSVSEALEDVRDHRLVARSRIPYLVRLSTLLDEHLPAIDEELSACLANWSLARLSRIDRAILRLAATELLHMDDVPPRASIQEAIHLAEQYGGDDSPRFVNGVLDALYRRSPSAPGGGSR